MLCDERVTSSLFTSLVMSFDVNVARYSGMRCKMMKCTLYG